MTSYRVNECFWAMFEPTFTQCLNRLQIDTFPLLVNLSHELAHIMTTYDFLSAKQAILSNVWTNYNLTQFCFWPTFDMNNFHPIFTQFIIFTEFIIVITQQFSPSL